MKTLQRNLLQKTRHFSDNYIIANNFSPTAPLTITMKNNIQSNKNISVARALYIGIMPLRIHLRMVESILKTDTRGTEYRYTVRAIKSALKVMHKEFTNMFIENEILFSGIEIDIPNYLHDIYVAYVQLLLKDITTSKGIEGDLEHAESIVDVAIKTYPEKIRTITTESINAEFAEEMAFGVTAGLNVLSVLYTMEETNFIDTKGKDSTMDLLTIIDLFFSKDDKRLKNTLDVVGMYVSNAKNNDQIVGLTSMLVRTDKIIAAFNSQLESNKNDVVTESICTALNKMMTAI